jgi:hypothetical protein
VRRLVVFRYIRPHFGLPDRESSERGIALNPRPPADAGGNLALLLAAGLVASPCAAAEGFHLFAETAGSSAGVRLQLAGLPPAEPLAVLPGALVPARTRNVTPPAPVPLPPYPTEKHFGAAAAELAGLEIFPWLIDRYVGKEPWAYISAATVRYNLQTGFTWDNDPFSGNQASHSYHGNVYFNAARTNGFSFWESAPFALAGSFLWEMFAENQPASINDLVNTTLGGMVWGEGQYRIANMVLDNTASGFTRFLREAGGLVLNPMGGFNRLIRGEMWTDFQNPPDRFPGRLFFELDGLYRRGGGATPEHEENDQGGVSFLLRYGDLFDGDHPHPFDYFDFGLNVLTPHATLLGEIVARGLLVDWRLSESPSAEQRLGLFLGTDYFNNEEALYGAQVFSASHLMRVPLWKETELRTEAGVLGMPIIALGTDYRDEDVENTAGRVYDYGPGFGAQASARVRWREIDLLVLSWSLVGQRKSNGISKSSRIQAVSAEARVPVTRNLVVGGGWSWGERTTTYDSLPTVGLSGTAWRVFAGWAISGRPGPQERPAEPAPSSRGEEIEKPWSVTAFGGGFFGTRVHTGPELNVLMASAPTYGLRLGYRFTRVFSLEAGWSRAATKLEPTNPATGAVVGGPSPVVVNTWELDGLFGFGGESVRGYVGVGAGAQGISPSIPTLDVAGSATRFAANIAIGGEYFVMRQLALRADARYRWRASDNHIGAIVCDSTGCTAYDTNLFSSAEVTGGVMVRF